MQTVESVVQLVGNCRQCEQVMAQAVETATCSEFRGCVGRIRQLLNEFGFQLSAEIRRIGNANDALLLDGDNDYQSCETSLRHVLESYQRVLRSHVPPHTRAMVNRQYEELQQLRDELAGFILVLQGLIDDRMRWTA